MKKIARSFFKKGDLFIYLFILILTIFPFLLQFFTGEMNQLTKYDKGNYYIEITFGENKYKYAIEENRVIELKNGLIIIEIKDKKVRVRQSDCKDKLCVRKSWIDRPGQFIICMPNKLVVKIIGDQEYDSISY